MRRLAKRRRRQPGRLAMALVCLQIALPLPASTQAKPNHAWFLSAGGSAVKVGGEVVVGPSIGVRRMLSRRFGLLLEGVRLIHGNDPYFGSTLTGWFGSFGPTWVWRGVRHDFSLSLGASAVTKWQDKSFPPGARGQGSTFGVFGAVGGSYWITGHAGLFGLGRSHLWYGDPGYSGSLGIAVRW